MVNEKKTSTKNALNALESGMKTNKKAKGKQQASDNKVEEYINFLKALASPERLSILEALESREMCTSDIEKKFFMEQSTASHHLNTLLRANIVKCRKTGRRMFYQVDENFLLENYKGFIKALENIPKSKAEVEYKTK
jgi:ArsR family transcriptional regulator, arsenate/arsenite/antimonite-responsive transcriptional repressor